jgi:hypothetical protein
VTKVHPVAAARALHRAMMHGEGHRIALTKCHDVGARLHARPLFGQDELAAFEVLAGL